MKYKNIVENYFEEWTEKSSYIAGFILGDGMIGKNSSGNYYINIRIHSQDIEILEFISSEISHRPIGIRNHTQKSGHITPYASFKVTSNRLCKPLLDIGIKPVKTGKEVFPISIPEKYWPDFIRGWFDADGSLAIKTNKKSDNAKLENNSLYTLSIACANKEILEFLRGWLGYGRVSKNHGCWDFNVSSRIDVCRFGKLIYHSKDIFYLKRKKDRFDLMPKFRLYKAFGEWKSIKDWSVDSRSKVSYYTLMKRIQTSGSDFESCLTTPIGQKIENKGMVRNVNDRWINCSIDEYILPQNLVPSPLAT